VKNGCDKSKHRKKHFENFVVLLEQQEKRIVRIILATRFISCKTSGKTHNQHKKQQNLPLSHSHAKEKARFRLYFVTVVRGSARRFPGPCSTHK
jgi:hypothetical protein